MTFLEDQSVYVTQDNKLIQACYSLSLNSKKMLALAISKVNPVAIPDNGDLEVAVTKSDWRKYFGGRNAYRDLKNACDALYASELLIPNELGSKYERIRWVQKSVYDSDKEEVQVVFTTDIKVLISDLYTDFTKYNLINISKIRSFHALRLYELIWQFRATGVYHCGVNKLRDILDVRDAYPRYADLKRFVISKALKEISKETNIIVELEEFKAGRKVESLRFHFKEK